MTPEEALFIFQSVMGEEEYQAALSILSKAKPMRVDTSSSCWRCPVCGVELHGTRYCPDCGQALDWRNLNDA